MLERKKNVSIRLQKKKKKNKQQQKQNNNKEMMKSHENQILPK